MLLGEAFGHWRADGAGSEQVVCRLCEDEAERIGWVRLDRPPERRTSRLVIAMYVMQGIIAVIVAGGLLVRLLQGQ